MGEAEKEKERRGKKKVCEREKDIEKDEVEERRRVGRKRIRKR